MGLMIVITDPCPDPSPTICGKPAEKIFLPFITAPDNRKLYGHIP